MTEKPRLGGLLGMSGKILIVVGFLLGVGVWKYGGTTLGYIVTVVVLSLGFWLEYKLYIRD